MRRDLKKLTRNHNAYLDHTECDCVPRHHRQLFQGQLKHLPIIIVQAGPGYLCAANRRADARPANGSQDG